MDGEDLELFRASVRHATATNTGAALDAALDELGWADALAVDPRAAVSVLFELQGASNATSSALDRVLAAALGVEERVAVVLPPLGEWALPGRGDAGRVVVRGLGTAALARHGSAVVATEGAVTCVGVDDLDVRVVAGLDPELGMVRVAGDVTPSPPLRQAAWADAAAAGQRALAHELVGASRTMLRLARDHALERIQFGQPIAGFQAVRHRLADTLVAIEAADAALGAAWDDGTPFTAALAKAIAGRSARTTARHCQQVLAGIGFTAEHPFHRHLRRTMVLDRLLGDTRSLTRVLGEELLRTRRLPAILPL